MSLNDSPIEWDPDEHAVTIQLIGPLAPNLIETWPEARFARTAGNVKGEIFLMPPASKTAFSLSIVARPPMPEPMMTPVRSALSGSIDRPASASAISEHARAYTMKSSFLRSSLALMKARGSKPFNSPAMVVLKPSVLNFVMVEIPDFAAQIPSQVSRREFPTG